MQFPESWLRAFCNPPLDSEQLAETLTMGGFEVEELRPAAAPFTGVVVARILGAKPHPDADRLRVCAVDAGAADPLQIVCGAPNARAGMLVPCALVGAELPPPQGADQPFAIKVSKLRGVTSQGMLCSGRELGLGDDHSGLLELDADLAVGTDLRQALELDEPVFVVKLTPDLGHALSVYGLARELAALTGAPLNAPQPPAVPVGIADTLPVRVEAPDLCGRFSGRIVRGVNTAAKTPDWMVQRLARCGQRSVSALVDISNYVLFELGQPTHIFDLARLDGGLTVRWGRAGEQLKLLNGNTVDVDETVGVIADERELESLAGIMGGDATAVSDDTRDIYIEAAFWWPDAIRGRSRRYNFATEAAHRFERGVDPAGTARHIERITQLVLDICGTDATRCGPVDDQQPNMPQRAPVQLRVARASKIIGMPVTAAQCAQVFERLGFAYTQQEAVFTVQPPLHRFDLTMEADLIEEVARIIGYDKLPETAPVQPVTPRVRSEARRDPFDVRHALARLGYFETINFSFVDAAWERDLAGNEDPIRLVNPIASQMNVMRSSLLGSLLQVIRRNVDHRIAQLRVFEVGRVFRRDAAVPTSDTSVRGVRQPLHVAGAIYGASHRPSWEGRRGAADFYDVKGDVEALLSARTVAFDRATHPAFHPGRCARVSVDGQPVGFLGELHPRWRQQWELPRAPVLFELELAAVLAHPLPVLAAIPRQLPVERDLAVVVRDAVTHDQLLHAARSARDTQSLLSDIMVFDIYRPDGSGRSGDVAPGEKSMALRLQLAHDDKEALTDARIEAAVQAVLARLQADCGARLRG
ncbi:MAG: phenylalanine--tRNA ligase subunit beta [Ottowia sp.]|nr:phenylalanine--tRNA ligase subunit beta [Ottowia sp.]